MKKKPGLKFNPGLALTGVRTTRPRGTPYNDLYGEASPKRPLPFRLQVIERVGIKPVEALPM